MQTSRLKGRAEFANGNDFATISQSVTMKGCAGCRRGRRVVHNASREASRDRRARCQAVREIQLRTCVSIHRVGERNQTGSIRRDRVDCKSFLNRLKIILPRRPRTRAEFETRKRSGDGFINPFASVDEISLVNKRTTSDRS